MSSSSLPPTRIRAPAEVPLVRASAPTTTSLGRTPLRFRSLSGRVRLRPFVLLGHGRRNPVHSAVFIFFIEHPPHPLPCGRGRNEVRVDPFTAPAMKEDDVSILSHQEMLSFFAHEHH